MANETENKFEQNIKILSEKAGKMGASSVEKEDAEKILRLFDPEIIEALINLTEAAEIISKKIEAL